MIQRLITSHIIKNCFKGKAIIIIGPRQSGKTTLLNILKEQLAGSSIFLNCDEPDIRELLIDATSTQLKDIIGNVSLVYIDEAQRVKNIGITLKLIIDQIPEVQLIVTGSSALELSNTINEPLTGRKFEYILLPFSEEELIHHYSLLNEKRMLERRILFGFYPEIVTTTNDKKELLRPLASSYLYKDIFAFQEVRRSEVIEKLLEALALQIGSEVSYGELSNLLGIDFSTVTRYIDLLEKAFVIFRMRSFSRNLRTELKKSRKIYFYDTGIRNAILNNFQSLKLRADKGALWENFLVVERLKYYKFNNIDAKMYFWRTRSNAEIDLIEEKDGALSAYEFKWSPGKRPRIPLAFEKAYPNCKSHIINQENYLDFVQK
ncbi:ATP-binding protein [bacterium]|nr:MAG: ATP-binding protein [bacterium]